MIELCEKYQSTLLPPPEWVQDIIAQNCQAGQLTEPPVQQIPITFTESETEFINSEFVTAREQQMFDLSSLSSKFSDQPAKMALAMLHIQGSIVPRADFASRLAILKQIKEICEKSTFDLGLALAQEEEALILLESSHNFVLIEQILKEILLNCKSPEGQQEHDTLIREANILLNLLIVESRLGDTEEIKQILNRICSILAKNPNLCPNLYFELITVLINVYRNTGNFVEAEKLAIWFLNGLEAAKQVEYNPDNQDPLIQICHSKLEEYPQTFQVKLTEVQMNLALATAHQGDLTRTQAMIAGYEQAEDGFDKRQILGSLYLELGRCLSDQVSPLKTPNAIRNAEEALNNSLIFNQQAGLTYHANEAKIEQILLRLKGGTELSEDDIRGLKDGLFECLCAIDPRGLSFGPSGESRTSFAIAQIQRVIAQLYSGENQEKHLSCLRNFSRKSVHQLHSALKTYSMPAETEASRNSAKLESAYAEFFRLGQEQFGFQGLYVFEDNEILHTEGVTEVYANQLKFSQLAGLQQELRAYAQANQLPQDNYQDILRSIKEKGEVVELNNFFLHSIIEQPFFQAIRTAFLTFSGERIVLIVRDANCHNEYTFVDSIALSNLFGLLASPSEDTTTRLKQSLAEAEEVVIPEGSPKYAEPQTVANLVFAETIGATPVSKGDFLAITSPDWLHGKKYSTINPIAVAVTSRLNQSEPGSTLMEQYLDASLEELMARDEDQLLELGILKKPLSFYGDSLRDTIMSVGSFGIKREFRSVLFQLTFAKLSHLIGQYSLEQNCEFIFVTAIEKLRNFYKSIGLSYHTFGSANYNQFSRIMTNKDMVDIERWQEYFLNNPKIIILRTDDGQHLFDEQIKILICSRPN